MRNKTIKIYEFNELNKKAQEKAINNYRKNQDIDYHNELLNELFKEIAEKFGFNNKEIVFYWSLGHCQGDGVSFTTNNINLNEFLKINKLLTKFKSLLNLNIDLIIKRNGSLYYHKNSVYVDYFADNLTDKQEALINNLIEITEEIKNKVCLECEKIGYAEYDYLQSDEFIKEEIKLNGYEFLENGKIF